MVLTDLAAVASLAGSRRGFDLLAHKVRVIRVRMGGFPSDWHIGSLHEKFHGLFRDQMRVWVCDSLVKAGRWDSSCGRLPRKAMGLVLGGGRVLKTGDVLQLQELS
jgi:hypothetical protein